MVGKGSPRFDMSGSPKLRRFMPTASGTKKKPSPKCSGAKKSGGSPRVVKKRADWNPALEKSLVDILHEYKESGYRGDNGWNSEGWNRMVKEFHVRNKYVSFTKTQIQDKEGQLKKDYKMLKAAKQESGSSWNEKRGMVEGPPHMWANLMVSYPKIKKFNNSKASFPLFDALGELYDGHLAEGNYNVTSLEVAPQQNAEEETLEGDEEDTSLGVEEEALGDADVMVVNGENGDLLEREAERNGDLLEREAEKSREEESEAPAAERSGKRRSAASTKKQEKEPKRPRRNEVVEDIMGAYLEMRTKESEAEAADRAREREAREEREREAREREAREQDAAQASDFSIRSCISILNTMDVTKEEKAKALDIFINNNENREAFICVCDLDPEAALIWLRRKMA